MSQNIYVVAFIVFLILALVATWWLYVNTYPHHEDNKVKISNMTKDAIFIGLIVIMTAVPNLGFISIFGGVITFTLLHLPVLLGASLMGWKRGAVYGLAFGIASWARSLLAATSAFDILFQNPLISILPRFLFGLIAGIVFTLLGKIKKDGLSKGLFVVSNVLLTCLHTVLVFSFIYFFTSDSVSWLWEWLFGNDTIGLGMTALALTVLGAAGEALLAGIFVPSLNLALNKAMPKSWLNPIKHK